MKKSKKIRNRKKGSDSGLSKEWKDRMPVFKFTGAFLIITTVFFVVTNAEWFGTVRFPLLVVYSEISSFLLNLFGLNTGASGSILSSPSFSVNIQEGCDAVAPGVLYAVSVLVFPIAWKWKWPGLLIGIAVIFTLNIFRIVTLFITGLYANNLFEIMHVEVWQAIFIVITVFIWLYWLRWASKKSAEYAKNK